MKITPCPECKSSEVYYGKVQEVEGGLRAEQQVYIPTSNGSLYADTYICLDCGNVRLFLDAHSKEIATKGIPKDKAWTKAQ